jgi:hypothetical protein
MSSQSINEAKRALQAVFEECSQTIMANTPVYYQRNMSDQLTSIGAKIGKIRTEFLDDPNPIHTQRTRKPTDALSILGSATAAIASTLGPPPPFEEEERRPL